MDDEVKTEEKPKRKLVSTTSAKSNCKLCNGKGFVNQYAHVNASPRPAPCPCLLKKYRLIADKNGRENVEIETSSTDKLQKFVINTYEVIAKE